MDTSQKLEGLVRRLLSKVRIALADKPEDPELDALMAELDREVSRPAPAPFSHAYDFAFEVDSEKEDGSDVTAIMLRRGLLLRLQKLTDEGVMAACTRFDTSEREVGIRVPAGYVQCAVCDNLFDPRNQTHDVIESMFVCCGHSYTCQEMAEKLDLPIATILEAYGVEAEQEEDAP